MDSESLSSPSESHPEPTSSAPDEKSSAIPETSAPSPTAPGGLRAGPLLGLMAACVAGVLGWGLGELIQPVFTIGEGFEIPSLGAPPEMFERSRVEHARVAQNNAAVHLAVVGGLLALALAAAEAGVRRAWLLVIAAPVIGLSLGWLGGYVGGQLHGSLVQDGSMTELTNVIKVHGLMLLPMGLGVGLAMGLVTMQSKTIIQAALVGAIAGGLAAVAYTLIISLAFSTIATEDLLPVTAFGRFVWTFVAAAVLGLIIPGGVRK
jgi:hypothetical protein